MNPQRKKNVAKFIETLLAKMEKGESEHGESLGGEIENIEEELLDICGWSFVRWERLQKAKQSDWLEGAKFAVEFISDQEDWIESRDHYLKAVKTAYKRIKKLNK